MADPLDVFPSEVWKIILDLYPRDGTGWLSFMLVSRSAYQLGLTYFDFSIKNSRALVHATEKGLAYRVKALLRDPRVDPNAQRGAPIRRACALGHIEIVKMLLNDRRVDPAADMNAGIQWASAGGHTEIVRMMLQDPRVDPSSRSSLALLWAASNGRNDIVKMLLRDRRIDPYIRADACYRKSVKRGNQELVQLFEKWVLFNGDQSEDSEA
ncbi:hypothetical protein PROFUN_12902 [Planoprotostelium fungivorum]|uniref:Uncharacterized protein n=1 Tax=Planoprotostelium fungivorum TaxID=1890364 RepID=A0A2P6MWM1_9EUKA|nr:hypothetical protein PROFUN_12902 [Planoprotostelium fungivorum]